MAVGGWQRWGTPFFFFTRKVARQPVYGKPTDLPSARGTILSWKCFFARRRAAPAADARAPSTGFPFTETPSTCPCTPSPAIWPRCPSCGSPCQRPTCYAGWRRAASRAATCPRRSCTRPARRRLRSLSPAPPPNPTARSGCRRRADTRTGRERGRLADGLAAQAVVVSVLPQQLLEVLGLVGRLQARRRAACHGCVMVPNPRYNASGKRRRLERDLGKLVSGPQGNQPPPLLLGLEHGEPSLCEPPPTTSARLRAQHERRYRGAAHLRRQQVLSLAPPRPWLRRRLTAPQEHAAVAHVRGPPAVCRPPAASLPGAPGATAEPHLPAQLQPVHARLRPRPIQPAARRHLVDRDRAPARPRVPAPRRRRSRGLSRRAAPGRQDREQLPCRGPAAHRDVRRRHHLHYGAQCPEGGGGDGGVDGQTDREHEPAGVSSPDSGFPARLAPFF